MSDHAMVKIGGARMWLKSASVIAWLAASYLLLLFVCDTWWQTVPAAMSLGFAAAAVGFNIQHDGGHRSFSSHKLGNQVTAHALDLIGGSSYVWNFKHNVVHHHYPNVDGVDQDLEGGVLIRMTEGQSRRAFHRYQQWYAWVLYALLPAKWQFYDDYRDVLQGSIGDQPFPRPRGWTLFFLLTFKAIFLGWAFAVPLALGHSLTNLLLTYALASATLGVTLATVFQLAHCVQEAEFHQPPAENETLKHCWAEHQLATTVNFAPNNPALCWYLGGLNHQVEHHLFPRISHLHYRKLAPVVRAVCESHNVAYREQTTLRAAVRSHFRHLKRLGATT